MGLELFFDLVFVLALTQCTALMAAEPTWDGLKGLLVLGVLWWSWVGYAWLTSVVDPEEGVVRFVIFAAMAALLVVALCVPEAFGDQALLFACAYAVVRVAHIALFVLASRDDRGLRAIGHRACGQFGDRRRPPGGGLVQPTARSRARCGRSRSRSTRRPLLFGSGVEADARATSPSATA